MSTATANTTTLPRGDSLVTGVAFMLVLNIVQRGVGFVRGLLFCRFLTDDALGLFSLANSFLLLAAPLVLLGLPGSLGRYVEYYRERGQLSAYLRKLTLVTLTLTGIGTLIMTLCAESLAFWVFDDPGQLRLLMFSLATLALVVAFNYLNELLTAIRQVRALSWMQFVNSLTFTVAGVLLVIVWESSAEAIVLAFALSCFASFAAIIPWYGDIKAEFQADAKSLRTSEAAAKLVPFAAWIWLTNVCANLADFVDRFLILHFSGLDSHAAQAMVGQYHSSRVVPILISTLGATVAAIVLPHWSHAWERNERANVSAQTNMTIKLASLLFTAGSLLVLWCSPLLFGVFLGGRYDAGLAALPWALVGCIWLALLTIGQTYLLCAEKAKLVTAAFALGLIANAALSYIALPGGLPAIMAARGWATQASALLVFGFNYRHGMQWTRGLTLALLAPLVVLAGPWLGTALLVALVAIDWKTHWLFDSVEEAQLRQLMGKLWGKVKEKLSL